MEARSGEVSAVTTDSRRADTCAAERVLTKVDSRPHLGKPGTTRGHVRMEHVDGRCDGGTCEGCVPACQPGHGDAMASGTGALGQHLAVRVGPNPRDWPHRTTLRFAQVDPAQLRQRRRRALLHRRFRGHLGLVPQRHRRASGRGVASGRTLDGGHRRRSATTPSASDFCKRCWSRVASPRLPPGSIRDAWATRRWPRRHRPTACCGFARLPPPSRSPRIPDRVTASGGGLRWLVVGCSGTPAATHASTIHRFGNEPVARSLGLVVKS